MAKKPKQFDNIPDEFVSDVVEVTTTENTRIGCMKWIQNEDNGDSLWISEAPISYCCWVHDGLTRMQLQIPNGQQLLLKRGQGLTAC